MFTRTPGCFDVVPYHVWEHGRSKVLQPTQLHAAPRPHAWLTEKRMHPISLGSTLIIRGMTHPSDWLDETGILLWPQMCQSNWSTGETGETGQTSATTCIGGISPACTHA